MSLTRNLSQLFVAALITGTAAQAEIATIKRVQGSASIERGKKPFAVTPGTKLEVGDLLSTGKDGRISVTFIDNTRFAVGPNSDVAISQFDYDRTRQRGAFVTQVNRGSLAVVSGKIAKSGRDAMKVRTPNSLLGVRGTRFIVQVPK